MPENPHRYFAFISYSHKDKDFAHELQHFLEEFRLPAELCARYPHVRRELTPLFRDEDNLKAGALDDNLRLAVSSSRFLIVICTENSARRNECGKLYVNDEINYFLSDNPEENVRRIIPVIYRREQSDTGTLCLPPLLRVLKGGILGIEVREGAEDKERSFSRIVASMLDLDPKELWRYSRVKPIAFQPEEEASLRYAATICHAPQDQDLARALKRELEHYQQPAALAHEPHYRAIPLLPVYELAVPSEPLTADDEAVPTPEQRQALRTSRFLIVICSPAATHPSSASLPRLSAAVQEFLVHSPEEKQRRVIPLLVRRPESENYTLPPILAGREEHSIELRRHGFRHAAHEVIATMLGVHPEALLAYEKKKRRRRGLVGLVATLCLAVSGWLTCDYLRPHTTWYADYVERDNMPCGLFELDEEAMLRRQYHYRFTTRRGRLLSVTCCNSAGSPTSPQLEWLSGRPVGILLQYDREDQLSAHIHTDEHGQETMRREFTHTEAGDTPREFIEFKSAGGANVLPFSRLPSSDLLEGNEESADSVTRLEVTQRDAAGHLTRAMFCNAFGKRGSNAQGIWGYEYERDHLGRMLARHYLDREGKPMENAEGISSYHLRYGEQPGAVTSMACKNTKGANVSNRQRWALITMEWTQHGNLASRTYHNPQGKPYPCKSGYAGYRARYHEETGQLTGLFFHGVRGEAVLDRNGVAGMTLRYNAEGRCCEQRFLGIDGQPCADRHNCTVKHILYDKQGRFTELSYFDAAGNPALHTDGNHRFVVEHHDDGSKTERYFGSDGQPCLNTDGFSQMRINYTPSGNCSSIEFFGTDGLPCITADGYSRIEYRHDDNNDLVEVAYRGLKGELCRSVEVGYARFEILSYDKHGHRLEEACFGTDDAPTLCTEGYARCRKSYDEKGRCTGESYFGTDGTPILCHEGYASITRCYDAEGNCVAEACFGLRGEATQNQQGWASITRRYNSNRECIQEQNFDTEGKPCLNKEGWASIRREFDEAGNCTREETRNARGALIGA